MPLGAGVGAVTCEDSKRTGGVVGSVGKRKLGFEAIARELGPSSRRGEEHRE